MNGRSIGWAILAGMLILLPMPVVAAPSSVAAVPSSKHHVDTISSDAQFTSLSKTIDTGRFASFPRILFVIDRQAKGGARVYFVNANIYPYHLDFISRNYLSTQSEEEIDEASYSSPNRRFVLGSVVRYPALDRYGVEFWEGDRLTPELLTSTMEQLQARFHTKLSFKPNSAAQTDVAAAIPGLAVLDTNQVYGSRPILVLNPGKATGRLKIVEQLDDDTLLSPDDIVILKDNPLRLSPVAGLVTSTFSTPLAHVNLLAKSWRIPNGYLKDAGTQYRALDGKMVTLIAKGSAAITIRPASAAEIAAAAKQKNNRSLQIARADLSYRTMPALTEQNKADVIRTGAKAANLGEVASRLARSQGNDFTVPLGFSIPFAYYADFVKANGLNTKIEAILTNPDFAHNAAARRGALAQLRADFVAASLDPKVLSAISKRRAAITGPGGVFVRSSTNSEDLKGFNGAGLYTSVPNVVSEADLERAIKTVWSSVWNDAAYEARMVAGIDHRSVMASVLIQRGMDATASGVMITVNPFDDLDYLAVFINAKRGLGIRVVEGKRVAEQLIYRPMPESIQVLTRSNDDAMLVFDENGGVVERPAEPGRIVLTDDLARRLAKIGYKISNYFGNDAQDIEWLVIGENIYIVQSRPYIRGN